MSLKFYEQLSNMPKVEMSDSKLCSFILSLDNDSDPKGKWRSIIWKIIYHYYVINNISTTILTKTLYGGKGIVIDLETPDGKKIEREPIELIKKMFYKIINSLS